MAQGPGNSISVTVKSGDTLCIISESFYDQGHGNDWQNGNCVRPTDSPYPPLSKDNPQIDAGEIPCFYPDNINCPFCGASDDWFDLGKRECRYCGFF